MKNVEGKKSKRQADKHVRHSYVPTSLIIFSKNVRIYSGKLEESAHNGQYGLSGNLQTI